MAKRPPLAGRRFGISIIGEEEVLVERVSPVGVGPYARNRIQDLITDARHQGGRERGPPEAGAGSTCSPCGPVALQAWELVMQAQRDMGPKKDVERSLRDGLIRVGGDDMWDLVAESFSDDGAMTIPIGTLLDKINALDRARRSGLSAPSGGGEASAWERPTLTSTPPSGSRDFRAAVDLMQRRGPDDFPLEGPRTVLFVLSSIADHYGSPEHWHAQFVSVGRLDDRDPGVQEHLTVMKSLHLVAVHDRLELPQLAWAELLCRRGQLIEMRYRVRFPPDIEGDVRGRDACAVGDASLRLGVPAPRRPLMISPHFEAWVSLELNAEYAASQEMRRALEELRLLLGEGR